MTKKFLVIIGVVAASIGLVIVLLKYVFVKKQTVVLGNIASPYKTITVPNVAPTVAASPVIVFVPDVLLVDKIGLTFEGQPIYKKFRTIAAPAGAIGYLADGRLLTTQNTVYQDGEYKRNPAYVDSGVVLSSFINFINVDGSLQKVYQTKTGVNLLNYFSAVGFLENGNMVFHEVVNGGQFNEYSYYRT